MNLLDFIIVVVVLLSALGAMSQGFLVEVFGFAGAVVGYVLAAWMYGRFAPLLLPYVKTQWVADLAAFLIIFIVVGLLAGIIGRIARWGAREVGLRWADRFLGGVFGLLRGGLIVTVVLLGMAAFQPNGRLLANSELAPYFLLVGRGASWLAPSAMRQQFRAGVAALRGVKANVPPLQR